jgi:hypothetical protein
MVVDWFHVAEDTDQWWAVVNAVMKLRSPQDMENRFNTWGSKRVHTTSLQHGHNSSLKV